MVAQLRERLHPKVRLEAAGAMIDNCRTCHGAKMVYQARPYYIGTRYYGELEEMVQCPDCNPVRCQECQDTGIVRYQLPRTHPDFGRLFPCPVPGCKAGREMYEKMQRAALRSAEIPEDYKALTFETWDQLPEQLRRGKELARAAAGLFISTRDHYTALTDIYAACGREYRGEDRRRHSLVFQGAVGLGKTGMAAAVANALVERGERVLYMRTRDMIQEIQSRYGKEDPPSAEDVLMGIQRADVLILDEFNITDYTPDRRDRVESVIRYRHNNSLPTIVTLNDDWGMVEANWGERTATVLRAMAHWILLDGAPIRNEGRVIADGGRR